MTLAFNRIRAGLNEVLELTRKDGKRVLVFGGRSLRNARPLFAALDQIHAAGGIAVIIEGGQRTYAKGPHGDMVCVGGADFFAEQWARTNGVHHQRMDAAWTDLSHADARIKKRLNGSLYDANAGPRRNQKMLEEKPDLAVATKGGSGTADMMRRVRAAGVPLMHVPDE